MSYLTHSNVLGSGSVAAGTTISVSFANWSSYRLIQVYFYGVFPATTSTNLLLRTSADGTTYDSAASSYAWEAQYANVGATGIASSAGDTSVLVGGSLSNTGTNTLATCVVTIFNPGNASNYSSLMIDTTIGAPTTSAPVRLYLAATRLAAQATKGVQLLAASGNVTGSYIITGIQ